MDFLCDTHHKYVDFCDCGHIIDSSRASSAHIKPGAITMKLRKILKSMFENYCKTFKDVPPGAMF